MCRRNRGAEGVEGAERVEVSEGVRGHLDRGVQLLRLGREGVRGHLDRGVQLIRLVRERVRGQLDCGVQADSTDLLREKVSPSLGQAQECVLLQATARSSGNAS